MKKRVRVSKAVPDFLDLYLKRTKAAWNVAAAMQGKHFEVVSVSQNLELAMQLDCLTTTPSFLRSRQFHARIAQLVELDEFERIEELRGTQGFLIWPADQSSTCDANMGALE